MKNKILIFGATGHLGAYTIDYLVQNIDCEKFDIIAIGRKDTDFFEKYGIEYYQVDITRKEDFKVLPKEGIHTVINLVGIMPASTEGYNPYPFIEVNILGMLNILEYCKEVNANRIVYTQTESDISNHWKEKENILIKPNLQRNYDLKGNYALYVLSKCTAMDLSEIYYQNFGIKRFILRLPTVYHYRPDPYFYKDGQRKMLAYRKIIEQAINGEDIEIWGNPKLGKDIVYVKDFAQYIEKIVLTDIEGGIYNVGTGQLTTLEQMVKGIIQVFSKKEHKSKIIFCPERENTRSFIMDIENAKKDLGYEPRYDYMKYLIDFKKEMELNRFKKLWE